MLSTKKLLIKTSRVMLVLILLASCSSNEKVITQDRSAEYRSAKSLPPLKKPSSQRINKVQVNESATNVALQTESAANDIEGGKGLGGGVQGLLVDDQSGLRLLYKQSSQNEVWGLLTQRLRSTSITIYHHNQAAGEFSVACSDLSEKGIDEKGGISESAKRPSGKWSFFKKDKEASDYCLIKLIAEKLNTTVAAYDRFGQQINSQAVKQILINLIN